MAKKVMKKIVDLNLTFFVRKELKQDHVIALASLIEDGVELESITVTEENEVVDGRHRIAAHELIGKQEICCEVVPTERRPELIMRAMSKNMGGPLPPSQLDITYTLRMLLEEKVSRKYIIEKMSELTKLPPKVFQRYLNDVQAEMAQARMRQAINAVANQNLTVDTAALKFDVNVEVLREMLAPDKENKKQIKAAALKSGFSSSGRSISTLMARSLKGVIGDYMDGLRSVDEIEKIIDHAQYVANNVKATVEQWELRFKSIKILVEKNDINSATQLLSGPTKTGKKPSKILGDLKEMGLINE